MKSNYKRIGDCIRLVDERNVNLDVTTLLGLSITKEFIPSVANIVGTDLKNYKIIRKNQFACSTMQVRRDKKMPVALLKDFDEAIISAAYPVFEVVDTDAVSPEYLMMWFSRSEFDREACFYAIGGVRGSIEWEDFCDMKLPVPPIKRQKDIVREYKILLDRIKLNKSIHQKLSETAKSIYNEWFVNYEFPDEEGNPYKSCGGEMKNSDLGEIPKSWNIGSLFDLLELQRGFDLPTQDRKNGGYPIFASTGIAGRHNDYKVKGPGIVTGRSGSLGEVFYVDEDFWPLNTTLWVKSFKHATPIFSYYVLSSINIMDYNSGSAVPTLNRNHIHLHPVIVPDINTINKFESIVKGLFSYQKLITQEEKALDKLRNILLSKLSVNPLDVEE
ncbi:hypothetical protein COJ96_24160 [Bacillus sp. AFS073361]|uniref:restriction endonuclease subunit S n=1 Tax=Bacillus sp. AFS073361 TaxID=2033511 RepID=UPI000BF5781F|nr:restriction endonuclease subunit S [Bacillus sp. AFS073361]PFP23501.1 hypothetical protein COJ96_24160 [Bacillus sp. AFS073361]